jgi:hypothetical protein
MRVTSSSPQTDITLVLVVVVFVFIVCQTPTFVDHILWTALDESRRACGAWHYYYTAVGDLLAICNSSVNFIIYVLTSPKFRQTLISMLFRPPICAAVAAKLRLGGAAVAAGDGGGAASVIVRVTRRGRTVGAATTMTTAAAAVGLNATATVVDVGRRMSTGLKDDVNDCAAETILLYRPVPMHGSTEVAYQEML